LLSGAAAGAAPPLPALPANGRAAVGLAALRNTLSASGPAWPSSPPLYSSSLA